MERSLCKCTGSYSHIKEVSLYNLSESLFKKCRIAFLANFIPTFGSIVSCILTILFAIANFYPSIWQVAVISVTIISVNFLIGNILEPKILGENLDLSPFIILVSLTVWGWIWGPVGMILSVPLMVTVKIVCENIPFLKPVAIFIGNK